MVIAIPMARALVLLLALPSLALGFTDQHCNWGDNYWCSSLPQASTCSALDHCLGHVWQHLDVPQDYGQVCMICKGMVDKARQFISSNRTKDMVIFLEETSCALIPISVIANECSRLVEKYGPEILKLLSSNMDPIKICTVIGLCNSVKINILLEHAAMEKMESEKEIIDCTQCGEVANLLGNRIAATHKNKIVDNMLEFCTNVDFPSACEATVLDQFEVLLNEVLGFLDSGVCDHNLICAHNFSAQDDQCQHCERVVQFYVDVYVKNSSLSEFKMVLDSVCERLNESSVDSCKSLVAEYHAIIYEFLKTSVDPHQVCAIFEVCDHMEQGNNIPRISSQDSKSLVFHNYSPIKDATCLLCEDILHKLQTFLEDGHTQEELKVELGKMCEVMPQSIRSSCLHFIESNEPTLIYFFAHEIEAVTYCKLMHLCSQQGSESEASFHLIISGSSCVFCKYVISTLDGLLEDKTNEKEIKEALDKLCSYLPMFSEQCDSFVEKYTDMIIDMLTHGITPDQLCIELGLCPSSEVMNATDINYGDGDVEIKGNVPVIWSYNETTRLITTDSACVFCKYVITTLDSLLEDKTSEKEIKNALETLCSYLPMFSEQCDSFVDTYTDMIIDLLTKGTTPEQLCEEMGLCRSIAAIRNHEAPISEVNKMEPNGVVESGNNNTSSSCVFCKYVITTLDSLLQDKTSEKEIKDALETLCSYLPMFSEQCDSFVETYTDMIIDLLTKGTTPEQLCEEMGLCASFEVAVAEDNKIEVHGMVDQELSGDSLCVFCKYVIKTLDGILEDKTDEKAIKVALETLCSLLPMFSEQCDSFVEKYTDMIIDLLTKGTTPDQLCKELGLCGPKTSVMIHSNKVEQNRIISMKDNYTSPLCTLCNYVLEELHTAMEDEKNEEKIKQTLEVVCNKLIVPIRKQCQRLIAQFEAEMIDLIVKDTAPEIICPAIGVCVDDEIHSNNIPSIDFLSSSQALVSRQDQEHDSKSDLYVDTMCKFLRKLIKKKGLDPANLPTRKVAFHKTVLGVTWYGSASVYDGEFWGLSSVQRSGRSSFTIDGNVATEAAFISIENPSAHYSADASFMGLTVAAGAKVYISDVQMYIVANMDPLEHGSRPQISTFRIREIGDIVVKVEGLGPLNWILDPLATCITNCIKDWIADMVEGPLREVLQEVLNKIIPPS